MTRTFAVIATAATLAAGTLVTPSAAEARCVGCAIGAGIVAGAVIGTAIAASSAPYYGPSVYYAPGPVYAAPCHWQTDRYWDGFGWRLRRVRMCY